MTLFPRTRSHIQAHLSAPLSRRARVKSKARGALGLPRAILIVDEKHRDRSLSAVSVLPRGGAVLLRDYHNPERHPLARGLLKLCRRRGVLLIFAAATREDVRFALRLGAHGLHFPEAALHAPARMMWGRRLFPRHWILTVSAHSRAAMVTASRRGFHAALLSPVFATTSHPGRRVLGPLRFSLLTRKAALPVFALGGIHAGNVHRLVHSGAAGIAAIEGFALEGLAIPPPSP